jgi:hypothetical protein
MAEWLTGSFISFRFETRMQGQHKEVSRRASKESYRATRNGKMRHSTTLLPRSMVIACRLAHKPRAPSCGTAQWRKASIALRLESYKKVGACARTILFYRNDRAASDVTFGCINSPDSAWRLRHAPRKTGTSEPEERKHRRTMMKTISNLSVHTVYE